MLRLSEVKSILHEYNIHPSKRLGQNFLIDQNIKNKIIESTSLSKEYTVLEIGPGLGALTQDLCNVAKRVIGVEKDARLYNFLIDNIAFGNLELINEDVLKYDILPEVTIVGNLPYYISTPILNHLIDNKNSINSAYITVQSEVAERIVAKPGTKAYGSLSCYAQFYGKLEILFKIPRRAFFPIPEVDSCFLKIDFNKAIDSSINQELLFKIIRSSFEKRRKTILNSLSSSSLFKSKEAALSCLKQASISPDRRPETVSLSEFARLSILVSLHFNIVKM